MLVTVDGIVIGRRNAGESGCYLDILTKEYGVIEVKAHGVKKINSKNAGPASLFSYSVFCMNKNGVYYTINSSSPKFSFHGVSKNIEKLSLAAYFSEIIKYTSAAEQGEDSNVLRFFAITLYELEKGETKERLKFIKSAFELRICALLGLMPDLRACINCACYEHGEMYFVLEESSLICGDCYYDADLTKHSCFLLSTGLLYLMRHILYSKPERVYKLKINGNVRNEFNGLGVITEQNLLYQLGRGFKTLDYYKKL